MNFFISTVAIIEATVMILLFIFSAQLLLRAPITIPINPSAATPAKNSTPSLAINTSTMNTSSGTNVSGSAPAGFRGPTSPPHIVGPSSPPPDY